MLIARHCVTLACAVCGLPFLAEDGEALHFDGPADRAIKEHLDGGEWATREDGTRLCYCCRGPAEGRTDNPLQGAVVPVERPCVLICCDACGAALDAGWCVPHFESADHARAALASDPGWPTSRGWLAVGDLHLCAACESAPVAAR